ncbi:hypothetical protein EGI11_03360 [Chryseobacterium sp. H3056]|uniref:Uncharacterized protein n=1 Tax=Kaistella daneshvariae TaxID=2487074 RepID=A0A3N0X0J9_9FLAO|nr:hypothetical protein [Kaistella daneshvariae]ROI09809.1 hypothetical protein EGI11_03360 [Kaistella daneshvariae]
MKNEFNSENAFWPFDKLDEYQSTAGQILWMIVLPAIFCLLFYKLHVVISLWVVYAAAMVLLFFFNALLKRMGSDMAMRFNLFFVMLFYVAAVLLTPWLAALSN